MLVCSANMELSKDRSGPETTAIRKAGAGTVMTEPCHSRDRHRDRIHSWPA